MKTSEQWLKQIRTSQRKLKDKFYKIAEDSEKHYYNDIDNQQIEVPLYWSMVQVLRNALYAKPPVPDVRDRNSTQGELDKAIAEVTEKAITYQIDNTDFYADSKRAVLDFLLCDLGVIRIDYSPTISGPEGQEMIVNQEIKLDHWPWKRFIYDIGKDWEECDWICYLHYMTAQEIKAKYNYDVSTASVDYDQTKEDKKNKVTVYEIWDKKNRKVIEIMEGRLKPLAEKDDPYRLADFFDCPKPMIANMRSAQYIPRPDFVQVEAQLDQIDMIEERIASLTAIIKDAGFYDDSVPELGELEGAPDGKLVAVSSLMEKLDGAADMSRVIAKLPIDQPVMAIQVLGQRKEELKQQIYEITGISDIVRGSTKASETATAQAMKGQWANVRLQDKQTTINAVMRQIMRMYAEIIGEHFTPQVLTLMTGVQVDDGMKEIMSRDLTRSFAIDVETDSTVATDDAQEKQQRNEMLQSVTAYLQTVIPLQQQGMIDASIAKELLLVNVRGYKHARNIEDMILSMDGTQEQLQGLQQQLQQTQQEAQMQIEQMGQQMQQMEQVIQQQQQQINEFNLREEQRKDIETQGEAQKDSAQANKANAEAEHIRAETAIGMSQIPVGLQ